MGNVPDKFDYFDANTADPLFKYKQPVSLGQFDLGVKQVDQGGGVDTSVSKGGKAGGPSGLDRKKYGRNLAEAKNQTGEL